jgi:hypothetical protein
MKNLLVYLLLFFPLLPSNALEDRFFYDANEAYGSQNYGKAIQLLESAPTRSFARYFNLGCAYLKNNELGNAWIAFEKARQMRPFEKNIRSVFQVLPITREQKKFVPFYQTAFVMDVWTVLVCFFFWLTILFWILRRMKKSIARSALYLSFAGCLVSGSLLYASSFVLQKCIVAKDEAPLHISPTSQSEIIKNLPVGTPITIAAKHGDFLYIDLKNGPNGWISCKNVQYILN